MLELTQPGHHALVAVQPRPDRQGVDEDAGDLVRAGQVGGTAGDGGAEAHVGLAAVPGQQQRPRTLDDGVDGEVVVLGDLPYPVGDAGG